MTQIEKQTLIKEICTRIPHGVKILYDKGRKFTNGLICQPSGLTKVGDKTYLTAFGVNEPIDIEDVRIIIRPMSSMTPEEKAQTRYMNEWECTEWEMCDYLNSCHLDYRGLISMGLALESMEGIYI